MNRENKKKSYTKGYYLLSPTEVWGIVEIDIEESNKGNVFKLVDFQPFCPYTIDLDYYIEGRFRKTVSQLFAERGEEGFRTIEHNMLHEVAEFEDVLVSTGGGTPCFFDNMAFMRQQGTTIYLKVSVEELAKRLELCKQTRPVLRNRSGEELKAFVQESLSARTSFYEQAQIIFNADRLLTEVDAKELSAQIVQLLK